MFNWHEMRPDSVPLSVCWGALSRCMSAIVDARVLITRCVPAGASSRLLASRSG